MSQTLKAAIAVVGVDIGKNSFHVVGPDQRGAMALRQKWSRGQIEARRLHLPKQQSDAYHRDCVGWHLTSLSRLETRL